MKRVSSPKPRRKAAKKVKFYEAIRVRSLIVVSFLCIAFSFMGVKLVWIAFVPTTEPQENFSRTMVQAPVRGDIYDRNGLLLASTLKVFSLYADPSEVLDVREAVEKLTQVFPDMDSKKLRHRIKNKKRRFSWVQRRITPKQMQAVNNLGLPGFHFRQEESRVYPQGNLMAHVLGGVNIDGKGISGVEGSYDSALRNGEDITLTVDARLQEQLRQSLMENLERTKAKASWAIAMEPESGDIMAMVSLPDYDLNQYGSSKRESWRNRAISGVYEMGSIFKVFTVAQALDEGIADGETLFDCRKPVKVGGYTIRDYHPKYKWMSMDEILTRSSNVGSARIADTFEEGHQRQFFDKLGFLRGIDVGFKEVGYPIYPQRRWGRIHTMTMSYGHGIAVTPIHMLGAVSAIVSDGVYRTPNIVRHAVRETPYRVVSLKTVDRLRELLRNVVENGTGRRAQVAGYDIGGKTGTAEKTEVGGYSKNKNLASFIGAVPLDDPKLVVLVMVDEGAKDVNTGGTAAAPVFKKFIQRSAPLIGLRPELLEPMVLEDSLIEKVMNLSYKY